MRVDKALARITFKIGDLIGIDRAISNLEYMRLCPPRQLKERPQIPQAASHTVVAQGKEGVLSMVFDSPEHIMHFRSVADKDMADKIKFLGSIPTYNLGSPAFLRHFSRYLRRRWYGAGTTLVDQEDISDQVFFVVHGEIVVQQPVNTGDNDERASRMSVGWGKNGGGENSKAMMNHFGSMSTKKTSTCRVIGVLGEGACFGDLGVLSRKPRALTLRAATDCQVMSIEGQSFRDTLAREAPCAALLFICCHCLFLAQHARGLPWVHIFDNCADLK